MRTKLWAVATRALAVAVICGAASLSPAQYNPTANQQVPDLNVTYSWPATGGASFYVIIVGAGTGTPNPGAPFDTFTTSATSFTSSKTMPVDGSSFTWVVYPDGDPAQVSPNQTFISGSGAALGTPNITYPPPSQCFTDGQNMTFAWAPVSGAVTYDFELRDGSTVIFDPEIHAGFTLTRTNINYSPADSTWTSPNFRVRACNVNNGNCGEWAEQALCVSEGEPLVVFSPPFSLEMLGSTSLYSASFNVNNVGSGDLIVNSVAGSAAWLTVNASTPFTVTPGGSQSVGLELDGSGLSGSLTDNVAVASNDPDEPSVNLMVTFNPPGGASSGILTDTFDIINGGQGTLDLSGVSITMGSGATITDISPALPASLAASERVTVTVEFDTAGLTVGSHCVMIEATSNAMSSPDDYMVCANLLEATTGGGSGTPHPADTNGDFSISVTEKDAYVNGYITGAHNDLQGALFAINAAAGGGAYCQNTNGTYAVGTSCS